MNGSAWARGLKVGGGAKGLVGHAGVVLLRHLADRVGLTGALAWCFTPGGPGWICRGVVLAQLAAAITAGAVNVADAERLAGHHHGLFGVTGSDSTIRRTLEEIDDKVIKRIARARARVRAHVWTLLALRPGGFPWLRVAGKRLTGWLVIDMDATIITAESKKQHAAATFKRTYGFHPLAAWCANTMEVLAMKLRPGNAGANDAGDHKKVLAWALAQVPGLVRRRILVRIDGAGATHELTDHLVELPTTRRTVRYTVGWKITPADEAAIAQLPEAAWAAMLDQDGEALDADHGAVAELTGLSTRPGWPASQRLIVRRVRPSARDLKQLTDFERATGWKYQITATNITAGLGKIPGTRQAQWIDAAHRHHAVVEDRVRTNKSMGLQNLPGWSWRINRAWMCAANIAADLDSWHRLLGLHDQPDLAAAEPKTMRYRLYAIPARLVRHARTRWLRLDDDWPWTNAFTTSWNRIHALPAPG